ncbi:MAG: hypothetical protein ACLQOZ_11460 [Acidimicrobiales bacterium]
MDFALSRKQLNKKRAQEQNAGAPTPPSPAAMAPPPAPAGPSAGVDPLTGLPAAYDPPAAPRSQPTGSEFFTSGAPVLGRQPEPVAAPLIPDTFGQPAPAGPLAPIGGNGSTPPATTFDLGSAVITAPAPMVAPPAAHSKAPSLVEGPRPRGSQLAVTIIRRYAGLVLFLVVAILLIEFLPSLRHSPTSPSGIGPVPAVAHVTASSSGGNGWVASGAGVVGVGTSYL